MLNSQDYWVPVDISIDKISLAKSLKDFFFKSSSDKEINQLIENYATDLNVICDRFEFVQKLQELKKLLKQHTTIQNGYFDNENINKTKVIVITREEKTELEGVEFNGVQYDIDALCQYLLLTIIDKITSEEKHEQFVSWLLRNSSQTSYSIEELTEYEKKYSNETGLRKNFIRAFNSCISNTLKTRILNAFIIAKVDLCKVNEKDKDWWDGLTDDEKINKIAVYLYDDIRCKYTHTCSKTLLNFKKITTKRPTPNKILINKVSPEKDNLILILQAVIEELVRSKYTIIN